MKKEKKYSGVIIPAVTPLTESFKLDEGAVERMFSHFRSQECLPFILGTTGEAASLSNSLKKEYIKTAGKLKQSGEMLYAGISSTCFEESVELAKFCFDNGVDAVAANLPSYYILSKSQIKKYFEQLADQCGGPMIIYNIPATTHMSVPLDIIDELSHHENIVATKDSERSIERLQESLKLWRDREDFSHFLGWAAQSAEALLNGSDGLIPSTGNLHPGIYNYLYKAALSKDEIQAHDYQKLSDELGNLYQSGKTLGESLWALKVLMQQEGLCQEYVMPPLQPQSENDAALLKQNLYAIMEQEGLKSK